MPDRIIRDELLTCERYWSICDEARLLYIHLWLSADDTARYTANNFSLRAKCFANRSMDAGHLEQLLTELVNQDLIRLYEAANERYLFIPRYRQRLRYTNSKFPAPPDDINDIKIEKADLSPTPDSRSEVKRSEENKLPPVIPSVSLIQQKHSTYPKPDDIEQIVWNNFVEHRKHKRGVISDLVMKSIRKEALKAGWSINDALTEMVVRNWQTIKAEYLNNKTKSTDKFAGAI